MSFTDPESNLKQFDIKEGMHAADFGAGSGFYSMLLAKIVGPSGRVYAIDVQKDMLERLKKTASKEGILNIEVIWGDVEKIGGSKLREGAVDRAIASNVLFQIDDKKNFVIELKRILKPGGKVLVVDWTDSFGGMGPAPEAVITAKTAEEMFEKEGFKLEKEISAGEHHYGLIFVR